MMQISNKKISLLTFLCNRVYKRAGSTTFDVVRNNKLCSSFSCDEASTAVSAAAARAHAAIDEQQGRLLDELARTRNDRVRQLDNHIAACDLQVCVFSDDERNG